MAANHREMINKCVGIVAEFDPFHLGHQWLIGEVKQRLPHLGVVCVMSGHFTQRGTAASLDKHARAEMALRGGADLVLELPVLWSASSAETFARGGVQCLLDTGVVEFVAFGSEDGDFKRLGPVAEALDSPQFQHLLKEGLQEGLSYAAARQQAIEQLLGDKADCLATANNNLGVEYLRALNYWRKPEVKAATFRRQGAGHDSGETDSPMVSASLLRRWMAQEDWNALEQSLPEESWKVLRERIQRGEGPASLERCQLAVLARLRSMTQEDCRQLPDWEEGLAKRIRNAAQESVTLAEFYDKAKTRRYPEARIRRMALWAFLNLKASDRPDRVPYLRVLGCSERGRAILKAMKKRSDLPILTKPGQIRKLDETAKRVFELECRATDLWRLCLPETGCRMGNQEWLRGPVVLPGQAD